MAANHESLTPDAALLEARPAINPDCQGCCQGSQWADEVVEALRATLDREREMRQELVNRDRDGATCEHCDMPMVCASAQAERIHGLELMHAETLTRAEAAERDLTQWRTRAERLEAGLIQSGLEHAALAAELHWPNIVAPPRYEHPAEGWVDPRLPDFRLIWRLARDCGYAVGIHGSLKRDVDLIAAPWTENAIGNAELVGFLCAGLKAKVIGGVEQKPHGRVSVVLQIDGYVKPIDLSILPCAAELQRLKEGKL